eukprot:TRINITY_DN83338_c0_g1_i1.p1 TRINITY_DN83338_c0_g1~~TRINITY_DN83338_c0_g1_i1.p1  ORF type:complete len:130 (+),score=25.99 TRINITY_DN83338_c0_g1_i1:32-391(+)
MAVVDRASLPEMQVVTGTVETLPGAVKDRKDLPGPAIVILGDVVGLRERLAGVTPPPLSDRKDSALAAMVSSSLPSLDTASLKRLRSQVDELLSSRTSSGNEDSAASLEEPPAKRSAPS